jgi:hypothetical protein
LSNYDGVIGDLNALGSLIDNPQLGSGMEGMLKLMTKNQGLAGLDKSKPWGAAIFLEVGAPTGYAFLPIADLDKLSNALDGIIEKPEAVSDGVYRIEGKNNKKDSKPPIYAKPNNGWLFISAKPEYLANLPDDPTVLLGGLDQKYRVAIRLNIADVPNQLREKFLSRMDNEINRNAGKKPQESDAEYALRTKVTPDIVTSIKTVINDMQEITLGWKLESQAKKGCFEVTISAKPDSQLARAMRYPQESHSRFAGFGSDDAAIVANLNGQIPAIKQDILKEAVNLARQNAMADIEKKEKDPAAAAVAKKVVDAVFPIIQDTLTNGRVDKGVAVILKPNALTLVTGGTVANNGRIEELAKTVLEMAKQTDPKAAEQLGTWVKFDVEKIGDISLHTISVPIPANAHDHDKLVSLVGETIEIVIGTSKDSVYVAAGREPMAALKKAIEKSTAEASKNVPPFELSVSLTKIADFLVATLPANERPQVQRVAGLLKGSTDDHVVLSGQPVENGVQYRLEIEPGVLKALLSSVFMR